VSVVDPVTIAKLDSLPLKARVIVEGALTGLHRARHHGSSVEFAQHKEYSPGDEVRHIDWKAFAKVDRYYIKQFEQESQLVSQLVLDSSGSMAYGNKSVTKLEYAAYLLAALSYLLIKQRDRVGLSSFGPSDVEVYVPPRARPAHLHDLLAVINDVIARGAKGEESAAAELRRIAELTRRRRSLVVVASDLFEADDTALDILRHLRAQGHDVVLFHVLDDDELEFPFEGLTLFEALEGDHKLLTNPGAIRKHYQTRMAEFLDRVKTSCVNGGVEYHLVPTSQPFDQTLLDFLRTRGASAGATTRRAWNS
jgi:uncharacterized protein (DUF58 family)